MAYHKLWSAKNRFLAYHKFGQPTKIFPDQILWSALSSKPKFHLWLSKYYCQPKFHIWLTTFNSQQKNIFSLTNIKFSQNWIFGWPKLAVSQSFFLYYKLLQSAKNVIIVRLIRLLGSSFARVQIIHHIEVVFQLQNKLMSSSIYKMNWGCLPFTNNVARLD